MGAVLLCGMLGSGIHTVLVEHVWCQTHAKVEHGDDHTTADVETRSHAEPSEPAPADDEPTDQNCDLHLWAQATSVPMPPIHASLLNLPPPAAGLERPTADLDGRSYTPIDILHVSPGLSPPSGLV